MKKTLYLNSIIFQGKQTNKNYIIIRTNQIPLTLFCCKISEIPDHFSDEKAFLVFIEDGKILFDAFYLVIFCKHNGWILYKKKNVVFVYHKRFISEMNLMYKRTILKLKIMWIFSILIEKVYISVFLALAIASFQLHHKRTVG